MISDAAPPVPVTTAPSGLPAAMRPPLGQRTMEAQLLKQARRPRRREEDAGPRAPRARTAGGGRLLCSGCALLHRASAQRCGTEAGRPPLKGVPSLLSIAHRKPSRKPGRVVPRDRPSVISPDGSSLAAAAGAQVRGASRGEGAGRGVSAHSETTAAGLRQGAPGRPRRPPRPVGTETKVLGG